MMYFRNGATAGSVETWSLLGTSVSTHFRHDFRSERARQGERLDVVAAARAAGQRGSGAAGGGSALGGRTAGLRGGSGSHGRRGHRRRIQRRRRHDPPPPPPSPRDVTGPAGTPGRRTHGPHPSPRARPRASPRAPVHDEPAADGRLAA